MSDYLAPFPWFGGKSRVAPIVWERFGADVQNYCEPFFGSGAVLLGRPNWSSQNARIETVNDSDGLLCNFWRSVSAEPEAVARWADQPVHECDLHARHVWLRGQADDLEARLCGDPHFYDAKIAGWWVWGLCNWIGSGFCGDDGRGPWVVEEDSEGVKRMVRGGSGQGVTKQLVHLGNAGKGVSRLSVALGGQEQAGTGACGLGPWMDALSERLRRVRVACGNWDRILGGAVTTGNGITAVFLDPPYSSETGRDM